MANRLTPQSILVAALIFALSGPLSAAPKDEPLQDVTLRVLSYNINGLPPPLEKRKQPLYDRIAEILRERRIAGNQPHIVLLQEAFDKRTAVIAEQTGYPYVVKGPSRREGPKKTKAHYSLKSRKAYAISGTAQKFTNSGLYILSDFPIKEAFHEVFDADACAGIDCLSNKSVVLARVDVPGLPVPVDIVTTHFNSLRSAKAPPRLTKAAHAAQSDVLQRFIEKTVLADAPVILAGDINTKFPSRYEYFISRVDAMDAGIDCVDHPTVCIVGPDTDPQNLVFNTNDKHFIADSPRVDITPIYAVRNFKETLDGRELSDHSGYEIHYRLSVKPERGVGAGQSGH